MEEQERRNLKTGVLLLSSRGLCEGVVLWSADTLVDATLLQFGPSHGLGNSAALGGSSAALGGSSAALTAGGKVLRKVRRD